MLSCKRTTTATIVCSVVAAVALVLFTRYRSKSEIQRRRTRKKEGSLNIGAIFGMDIGGTLTKIVYFEPNVDNESNTPPPPLQTIEIPRSVTSSRVLQRTNSLVGLDSPDHQAALQELYTYLGQQTDAGNAISDAILSFHSTILGGRLHFIHFETRNIESTISFLGSTAITENIRTIGCTGGGAHKYSKQFEEELEITVLQMDELGCLLRGMHFALTNVIGECYTYRLETTPLPDDANTASQNATTPTSPSEPHQSAGSAATAAPAQPPVTPSKVKEYTEKVYLPHDMFTSNRQFPYLVVNIGSGVSILKVTSPGQFERVSGTSLGGGTYWGLCRLLTSCSTYEEVLDIAETGDASEVDMLVRDIYGGGYDGMKLNGSMVASSFGKLVMKENPRAGVREQDLALALLMMITNNIGQVAYLNARLHNCTKIFFVGSFLRHNTKCCKRLAFAIDFWSQGMMEGLFLKHEGYFGALGTFLQSAFGSDVDKILSLSQGGDSGTEQMTEGVALSFAGANASTGSNNNDTTNNNSSSIDNDTVSARDANTKNADKNSNQSSYFRFLQARGYRGSNNDRGAGRRSPRPSSGSAGGSGGAGAAGDISPKTGRRPSWQFPLLSALRRGQAAAAAQSDDQTSGQQQHTHTHHHRSHHQQSQTTSPDNKQQKQQHHQQQRVVDAEYNQQASQQNQHEDQDEEDVYEIRGGGSEDDLVELESSLAGRRRRQALLGLRQTSNHSADMAAAAGDDALGRGVRVGVPLTTRAALGRRAYSQDAQDLKEFTLRFDKHSS